ncbi:hypothetical protein FF124_13615 [Martelella lutilitoris]|uniref:Uncharacterized protein n=1 Tax=Martelella lutilitoris TaxID=2583532 RepID=A0A5C4JPD4_9HYPH|nr:hypothetical protein [Martelella lutilitoris]TNB47208.1 hypothetical protein FF124_13615 [Martelella lutilitoris]
MADGNSSLYEEVGAALDGAQHHAHAITSLFARHYMSFHRHCRKLSNAPPKSSTKTRIVLFADSISGAFNSATRAACFYFSMMELIAKRTRRGSFEGNDLLFQLAHTFADSVPMELSNHYEILHSVEAEFVLGTGHKKACALFRNSFPNLEYARNAVAHGGERSLAASSKSKQRVLFHSEINTARLSRVGKIYLGNDGIELEMNFEQARLQKYWEEFSDLIEEICA